ncbi:hypothetical protein D9Q98_001187 [Chlorella vulgaris]|uniref:isoamylase n=1 Tax=Chlorella vulgaris TaxID=3077 RepID=A0A9D4TZE6_CHLVU|nr:hypothetical protein D9Q98_001187 [Chlorella vulgaris]
MWAALSSPHSQATAALGSTSAAQRQPVTTQHSLRRPRKLQQLASTARATRRGAGSLRPQASSSPKQPSAEATVTTDAAPPAASKSEAAPSAAAPPTPEAAPAKAAASKTEDAPQAAPSTKAEPTKAAAPKSDPAPAAAAPASTKSEPTITSASKEPSSKPAATPKSQAAPAAKAEAAATPKAEAAPAAKADAAATTQAEPKAAAAAEPAKAASPAPPTPPAKLEMKPGSTSPLGASPGTAEAPGVNFALYAPNATSVTLCLSDWDDKPLFEAPLQREGDVWHGFVPGLPQSKVLYGYRVDGNGGWDTPFRWDKNKTLLDPYAKYVKGRAVFGQRDEFEQFKGIEGSVFRGTFDFESAPFDWGSDYKKPNLPLKDLIIAELPVRLFTASESSGLPEGQRGTYAGLAAKVEHFKELGINAVELLPVFEYDELEFQRSPNPRDHMVNVWGYSHLNFFGAMSRFAKDGGGPLAAAREFKEMVKVLHGEGIEVIVDVVYNHTVEGADQDPYTLSWRGIDSSVYYQQDPDSYVKMLNWSGCGNTVNANHPHTLQQIVDSLKWWVEEYHVDGFRFDLAPCLCRDERGHLMSNPPLMRAISKDPVLSKVKLLAEPWDLGAFMVGSFPNWDIWGEWNGKYRDDVRRFIRGDPGLKSEFATRLAGSADLYNNHNRKPYHSINFIIAHDGFTLADMVSYNEKHNSANGEDNRDGTNDNFSWNCGVEGDTDNEAVLALRQRQMRNYHLALMLSQGTPMLLIGDEYGQTRGGNNNYYGHDTAMTHYKWDQLEAAKEDGWFRFYSELIKFRRSSPLLGRAEFMGPKDVTWHEDRWEDPESRFLAFTLHDRGQGCGSIYAAFNAHSFEVCVTLPNAPHGKKWCRVVDTNLAAPKDFTPGGNAGVDAVYCVQPNSSIMLIAKDA